MTRQPAWPFPSSSRYSPLHILGHGGMGAVWCVEDQQLGRRVALKLMHPGPALSLVAERFAREARSLAALVHPRVVRVYDAGQQGETSYIAMELLHGETLAERLGRGRPAPREALMMLDCLLEALECVHAQGFLHRDLKPSNVFLDVHRGPVLIDFGLVRDADSTCLTRPGTIVGTPRYFSRESLRGEPYTTRTDLFVAGLIGLEALSDVDVHAPPPGIKPSLEWYLSSVASGSYHELARTALKDLGRIGAVVLRAIAPEPEDRFASVSDMRAALIGESDRSFPEPVPLPGAVTTADGAEVARRARKARSNRDASARRTVGRRVSPAAALVLVLSGLGALLSSTWRGASSVAEDGAGVRPARVAAPVPELFPRSNTQPLRALRSPDGVLPGAVLAQLQAWPKTGNLRQLVRSMARVATGRHDSRSTASRARALLTTSGLAGLGTGPVSIEIAARGDSGQRLYDQLFWRQALEHVSGVDAQLGSVMAPLWPHDLKPAAPPPAVGRSFTASLAGEGMSDDQVQRATHRLIGFGLAKELSFSLGLSGVRDSRQAWIGLYAMDALVTHSVWLTINNRLSVGLLRPPGSRDPWLTHTIPVRALVEGENRFAARLRQLGGLEASSLSQLGAFRVVLVP